MTDAYTDELFNDNAIGAHTVIFPVSRLVLDPERFLNDDQEIMAALGMGVIYTRTSSGQRLRRSPTSEERAALINRYYRPHHRNLADSVSACVQNSGRRVIIDCHSFPSVALPYELDQSAIRPDICIGADSLHTPAWLKDLICDEFEKVGYSTTVNKPFAGTIVPMSYYQKEPSVVSIMVEVSRKLYMDESTGIKNSDFNFVRRNILSILNKIRIKQINC
jgi:N-formylglutamate deformylase